MIEEVLLDTDRLLLRRLTEDDADDLFQLHSDPEVMRFLTGGVPETRTFVLESVLPQLLKLDEPCTSMGFWAAIEKASGNFMGWFHFRPFAEDPQETELGYRLKRVYWGRGLATEGSIALIDKGFRELGVAKVVATAMALNVRSRRVLEKAGLQLEMTFVYPGDPFPGWPTEDCMEVKYGLTRERWALSPRQ